MHKSEAEASTLLRPPGEAAPRSDGLTTTLHPSQRTPAPSGVDPALRLRTWNLPLADRQRYLLHGVVAEGGHGRILRAEDLHLERMVALKEPISAGGSTEQRFLREARLTARLQHPSIVPVYEAGRWPDGEPFYAMKLVSGRSLAHLIDSARSLGDRLAALPHVLAVAEAIAYAHSQRIIHRDLKPANVLVGEFGETVVVDWGLAKELDAPEVPPAPDVVHLSPAPEHTQAGTVMGTPAYMPPEQAAGQPVDERADVYALGAILYHLLAGKPPYTGTASQEVLQQVLKEEPRPLPRLQPGLPEELLAIVSRAMAREPSRRYPTARELAEDLRRYQTGQLVGAHHYTASQRMRRFARQYRTPLTGLAVATVAMVLLAVKGVMDHQEIHEAHDRAEAERALAQQRLLDAERASREASQRADAFALLQARNEMAKSPDAVLRLLASLSPTFSQWGQARVLAADAIARGLPLHLRGHTSTLNGVDFSPDGRWLASASDDRTVRLWDVRTQTSRVLETYGDEVWRVRFSQDGRFVASGGKEGLVKLWDSTTGTSRSVRAHTQAVRSLLFSRDERQVLSAGYDDRIHAWDIASGKGRVVGTHAGGVVDIHPLADGRHLLSVGMKDQTARVWNLEHGSSWPLVSPSRPILAIAAASRGSTFAASTPTGQVLLWDALGRPPRTLNAGRSSLSILVLSPDGRFLAAQSDEGPILLWDLKGGPPRELKSTPSWMFALTFSEDGRWLAAGGKDGTARLWEVATGRMRELPAGSFAVSAVRFSRDGKWLATGTHDQRLRLHAVEEPYPRTVAQHEGALPLEALMGSWRHLPPSAFRDSMNGTVSAVAFTPDGRHILSAGERDGRVRLSRLESSPGTATRAHPQELTAAFALPDGTLLATAGLEGTVALWDAHGRLLRRLTGPSHRVETLTVSADRARVAAGDTSGTVWLWDAVSGQGRALGRHEQEVLALAFSPEGLRLASGGKEGQVRLWDVASGVGQPVHQHQGEVMVVAFSPDGRTLASGSQDHTVWLQPLGAGEGRQLDMGATGVLTVRFSPDGRELLITSLGDPTIRRRDAATGEALGYLAGHSNEVFHTAYSPEGQRLVSASTDGTVRLWDLKTGEGRTLHGHEGPVVQVAFSPDGRHVLSAGQDGTVRLWPDELPLDDDALRGWVKQMAYR